MVRGNTPLLFLVFFGLATLLVGFAYQSYGAYASTGSSALGLVALSTGVGGVFSMAIVARILYRVAT